MGMRQVIRLHPFTLNILVTPLDTEGNNERVRGGWRRVGVERGAERVGEQGEEKEQDRRKKLGLACQNTNQSNHTLCHGGC